MSVLLYLLYGNRREYHDELTYSVMSASRFARDGGFRIALLADEGNQRPDLPVENVLISAEMMRHWQLDGAYNHAAQAYALHFGVQHFNEKAVLVDTDTFFVADPRRVFDQVGPGKAVMHVREGPLSKDGLHAEWARLVEVTGGELEGYAWSTASAMYNAGVMGVDPADAHWLEDVKSAMRRVRDLSGVFTAVQVAASVVLQARTRLSTCEDAIRHYWDGPRAYFHYQIKRLYPHRDAKQFESLVARAPVLQEQPPRQLVNRVAARAKAIWRGADDTYGYALLAYRSALSLPEDPDLANVWASIAVDTLTYGYAGPAEHAEKDFAGLGAGALGTLGWLSDSNRSKWKTYWARRARGPEPAPSR